MVHSHNGNECSWEQRHPPSTPIFSKLSTYTNWNNYNDVGSADVMIIYLK